MTFQSLAPAGRTGHARTAEQERAKAGTSGAMTGVVTSGLGYVLLANALSDAVLVSAPLLLVVVTTTGITLRTAALDHADH
jgi:hypothetical protein